MKRQDGFRQIFQASPVPTVILTGKFPAVSIKEANVAYICLTGRQRKELIGADFFIREPHPGMFLHDTGFVDVKKSIARVYLEKRSLKTPVQKFLRPITGSNDLETIYLEATNTPMLDEHGEIDYIIRTLQNVTKIVVDAEKKQKANDRQLMESEWLLRETQRIAKIGSWEMDRDHNFQCSDIHYEVMEVPLNEKITMELGLSLLKEKKDKESFEKVYYNANLNGNYFDVELNIITPKGNERWIRYTGKGDLENGKFLKMYGVAQDITEKKMTEEQLVQSKNQMEMLVQTVNGVVFESDAETFEFIFVSEQIKSLLGYTPDQFIKKDAFKAMIHPEDREKTAKEIYQKIKALSNYTGDYRAIRRDGAVIWVKLSVSVISKNGKAKWLRGLMIDITASKRISEIEHLEKKVLELNANPLKSTASILTRYLKGIESIFPEMHCSVMQVKQGHLYNWINVSLPAAYLKTIDQLLIADNIGSCGTAAFRNEKVIVSDISADPRWSAYKETALKYGLHACWSQPIANPSGEVVATFGIYYNFIKRPTAEESKVVDRAVYLLQLILQERKNLELLEEANFLMQQSQELAKFGSIQLDIKSRELTWSNELYNIFGIDQSVKPTIDDYYNCLHPEYKDSIILNISKFLKNHKDFVSEERIIRPDGEIRDLKAWGRIKIDQNGEATKVIGAYMDITDSKKVQEELAGSERRLRSLVDSQTNYVIRMDLNENYTYANNKYLEDFVPEKENELVGTNALLAVLPSQRKSVEEIAKKCIANPDEVFEIELIKHDKEGNTRHIFWHFKCLTNMQGNPTEFQCIGIDVSELKKVEDEREKKALELLASEKRYSDLFHLSPLPMWVYDFDSLEFLDVNDAAIQQYGYSRNEFLSMTIKDIRPKENYTELLQAINDRNIRGAFYQGIFTHQLKNRELIQVDVKRNKIFFKGKVAHLILANNITERMEYLQELEKQNERLNAIAWIQLHVVRAPLARIMGLVDVIENYNDDPEDQSIMLQWIVESAIELDNAIRDIVRKAE